MGGGGVKMSKWKFIGTSKDGTRNDYLDAEGNLHSLRTAKGKSETYQIELRTGKRFCSPLYDDYGEHGKPLTVEEKAFRRGWLSAFREQERIKARMKKR